MGPGIAVLRQEWRGSGNSGELGSIRIPETYLLEFSVQQVQGETCSRDF